MKIQRFNNFIDEKENPTRSNSDKDGVDKQILDKAIDKFKAQFKHWAFDEQDEFKSLTQYIEEVLGRDMTNKERQDSEQIRANKKAEKIGDAAVNIAYQSRLGNKVKHSLACSEYERLFDEL